MTSDQMNKDTVLFADDDSDMEISETPASHVNTPPWKVLIVDDEPSIHEVTKLALTGFTFANRPVEFLSAYSGVEANKLMEENPDCAIVLLDVVMEHDHAGLDVAKYIREELNNKLVRIILRTGQPGQAPEREVITNYDINDYKAKTELTSEKLFTVMYSSLRSYRDLITIERNRKGLGRIIESSKDLFQLKNLNGFTEGVLEQLTALTSIEDDAVFCHSLAAKREGNSYPILAGTGEYSHLVGQNSLDHIPDQAADDFILASETEQNIFTNDRFVGHFKSVQGSDNFLYLKNFGEINQEDHHLINLFIQNVSIAHENVELHNDLEETKREIVYLLGEAVETRSKETGNHVKRVAEFSKLLALKLGLDADEAETIKMASPLHDLGKIGIPDAILNKPGRHTDEERKIMKTHAQIGADMLGKSKKRILHAGSIIAAEHHERWDGAGYPNEKKGEDIHIYGRITAITDVFDALGSDRCYKPAWPMNKILDLFHEERGRQFDPELIDLFFENMDSIITIRDQYSDKFEAA